MTHPMVPPSTIDSSLLKRSIEQWEELLTCHQCHRIVESVAKLWEGENQQSLCSRCCPNMARTIFTCINKPTIDIDNPNASDPGRVVQVLKSLLAAYQHQERKLQERTDISSSFATHDKPTHRSGHVQSTLYQTTNVVKTNLTTRCHQEDGQSLLESADDVGTEHDSNLRATSDTAPQDCITTQQQGLTQTCTQTPSTCQEQSEQQSSTIPCSSPCHHSSTLTFESQHVGMSHSNSASTATPSTQQHSQQDLLLSLPETADFERIFPGPIHTTQTSHQSQPEGHQPDNDNGSDLPSSVEHDGHQSNDNGSELLSSIVEFSSKSPQLMPQEPSNHAAELVECQLSCSSRLPETADFDNILGQPSQGPTDAHDNPSTSDVHIEESELPLTEDFDRIYPIRKQEDHGNAKTDGTSTNDQPTVIAVPCPAVVSPVDGVTATKLREQLEHAVQSKKKDSAFRPIITPRARNKRCHDSNTDIGTKTRKSRRIGDNSEDPSRYSPLDTLHKTRRTFPCLVRQHPFGNNAQSDLGTINICARSFQYIYALANGWNIEGENGETIWGDAQVYAQTIAQLTVPTRDGNSWIEQAPWWGTTRQSPCPRLTLTRDRLGAPIKTKLLDGYRILLISNRDFCNQESVPIFDFTVLHDRQEFKSLTFDEMMSLCQAAGVEILESISPAQQPAIFTEKLLIVVAEEIDDEIFKERLFPRLVERCILPTQCKVHFPPSFSETNAMIPIVYFSWIVQSIAAGIVAPTSPYALGMLHL